MLRIPLISVGSLILLAACERSADSKLIGSWRGQGEEMAGEIQFASDHTFTSHERDATNSVSGIGDWRSNGKRLVLNFRDDAHQPKHREFIVTVRDDDHIALRQPSGSETTLERSK